MWNDPKYSECKQNPNVPQKQNHYVSNVGNPTYLHQFQTRWHSINKLICRAGTPRKFQLSHIQTIFPKKSCVAAIEFNLKSRRKKEVAALVGKNTAVVLLMEPSLKYAMGPQEDSTKMLSNISRGGSCFHPSIKLLTVATLSGNAKQPSEKASGVYIKAVFLGRVDPCEVS